MVQTSSELELDPPNPFTEVQFKVWAVPVDRTFVKFEVQKNHSQNWTELNFGSTRPEE